MCWRQKVFLQRALETHVGQRSSFENLGGGGKIIVIFNYQGKVKKVPFKKIEPHVPLHGIGMGTSWNCTSVHPSFRSAHIPLQVAMLTSPLWPTALHSLVEYSMYDRMPQTDAVII